MDVNDKIKKACDFISESFYVSSPNMGKYNDVVLFSILNGLIDGNMYYAGNPGLGKTTAAEAATSLLYGYPVEMVQWAQIKGHPFQTEEKILGRPNLAALNKGVEDVVWSAWTLFDGPKIIDEMNRLPEGTQNMILEATGTGVFKYLNSVKYQRKNPFYATGNYADGGNTDILPPLADRFDVSVEVVPPVGNYIAMMQSSPAKAKLSNPELAQKTYEAMNKGDGPTVNACRNKFREQLQREGLPVFTENDKAEFAKKLDEIEPNAQSLLFIESFFDQYNAMVRPANEPEPAGNHYEGVLAGHVKNNLSNRAVQSLNRFAPAYTAVNGKTELGIEEIQTVLPYVLMHRMRVDPKYVEKNKKPEFFPGSQRSWTARMVAADATKEFLEKKDMLRKYYEAHFNGHKCDDILGVDDPSIKAIEGRKGNL